MLDGIPILQEACGLAKAIAPKNPSSLPLFLSFVQKVIEVHGDKAEMATGADSDNETIRGIVTQLMLLSYEGVMARGQSTSTPQNNEHAHDIMSPMFKTLSACATKCPIFLLTFAREGQPAGELIVSSIQAAPGTLSVAEIEVSSSTIDFLKALVS